MEVITHMEGLPFNIPFIDFVRGRAESLKQQRRRASKREAHGRRSGRATGGKPPYPALVDNLFFRVLLGSSGAGAKVKAIAGRFRAAFVATWGRIPERDRLLLRRYWGRDGQRGDTHPTPHSRPQIRVVAGGTSPGPLAACENLGNRLCFTVPSAVEHPDRLPRLIAHTMAQVYLFATRKHWSLALEMIEEPLADWERRQSKKADGAARERKLDLLEAAHRQAYEAELEQRLRSWGFDGPALEEACVNGERGRGEV
jgi:hypothetical protein